MTQASTCNRPSPTRVLSVFIRRMEPRSLPHSHHEQGVGSPGAAQCKAGSVGITGTWVQISMSPLHKAASCTPALCLQVGTVRPISQMP